MGRHLNRDMTYGIFFDFNENSKSLYYKYLPLGLILSPTILKRCFTLLLCYFMVFEHLNLDF